MKELPDVRPGQVWADNDWRSEGRKVEIIELTEVGGEPAAKVKVIAVAKGSLKLTGGKTRFTLIRVRRFVPNSTGYRLVKDV